LTLAAMASLQTSGDVDCLTAGGGLTLPPQLRVCELFAGIGGWRLALGAALPAGVEAHFNAFDSGPHCSEVYALNFGEPCCRRNIEQLALADLDGYDLWAMSPPCQPFTATKDAQQLDSRDKRCKALSHLCGVLPRLEKPPRWIVVENVKGFYSSNACDRLRAALTEAGYTGREILLDLASFGAPNHRTRYYLLAERSQRLLPLMRCSAGEALNSDQDCLSPHSANGGGRSSSSCSQAIAAAARDAAASLATVDEAARAGVTCRGSGIQGAECRQLAEYLLREDEAPLQGPERAELLVPRNVLEKPFAEGLSYVRPSDCLSFCFTGHYGKVLHKSSGSLLHLSGTVIDRKNVAGAFGNVRFFSPREILNIFGFPRDFLLPLEMPLKHRYKVVGNSIAVTVASFLLRWLLLGEGEARLASLDQDPPCRCPQVSSDASHLKPGHEEAFIEEDTFNEEAT